MSPKTVRSAPGGERRRFLSRLYFENVMAQPLAGVNRIKEAIDHVRIVLKARPDDVQMYCNLGVLLEQQGRIDEAIEQYRRALQIDPDFTKANQLLQQALAGQKNTR